MRNFTFNSGEPFPDIGYQVATQSEITELQNLIGVDMPQHFIDFHLMYGSCNTKECYIMDEILSYFYPLITPIMDFSCASEVTVIKQLLIDYIVEKETYDEPVHEYLRSSWLPFGDDPFGNYFCIKLTGIDQGSVHLLLPEFSADENPFKFLANSFDEFLNALTSNPEEGV